MKIVISGGTGYIGSGVVARCLEHPEITSVLILSRREVKDLADHPKARVIVVEDFTAYKKPVIDEIRTADAAIWCLGTSYGDAKTDIEFPLAFINIIKTRPDGSKPFRYVQLSGALTEPPPPAGQQPRSLWFFANGRRVRGAMEQEILETAKDGIDNRFQIYLVKPGGVMSNAGASLLTWIVGDTLSIMLDELSAAMIDLAVNGNEQRLFSNRELIEYGRAVIEKMK